MASTGRFQVIPGNNATVKSDFDNLIFSVNNCQNFPDLVGLIRDIELKFYFDLFQRNVN